MLSCNKLIWACICWILRETDTYKGIYVNMYVGVSACVFDDVSLFALPKYVLQDYIRFYIYN